MTREELLLAALASTDGEFSPVQIQKTIFLLDRKVPEWTGGPHFNFKAYDYGPFDQSIYQVLTALRDRGLVEISGDASSKHRRYALTALGREQGVNVLAQQPTEISSYFNQLTEFVKSLGFAQLVSTIYNEFPEMKVNSVFKG
jgi:uncharacterized protein